MTPPRHANPELEAAVVGALLDAEGPLLHADTALLLALTALTPEDFTDKLCRRSMRVLCAIGERRGTGGALAVWASLRNLTGTPADGHTRLQAWQGANTLNRVELAGHATALKRLAKLRRLEDFHRKQLEVLAAADAQPDREVASLEEFARYMATNSEVDETAEVDAIELDSEWEAHTRGEFEPLLPTGVEVLDNAIIGWERNLNIVGGLPGVGKSSLLATVITNQLRAGHKVGLFGLEEGTRFVLKRLLAQGLGLGLQQVGRARLQAWQQEKYQHLLGDWHAALAPNFYVHRTGGLTASQLVARAKRWVVAHGVSCIYVDHGGEVQHEPATYERDKHDRAYASTCRALRNLALNYKVPVVLASHFNRDTYERGRPSLKSFAHSEEVGRMASTAVGLWRQEDNEAELLCEVIKQRQGRRGFTLRLEWDAPTGSVLSQGGGEVDWKKEAPPEKGGLRSRGRHSFTRVLGEAET